LTDDILETFDDHAAAAAGLQEMGEPGSDLFTHHRNLVDSGARLNRICMSVELE